MLNCLISEKNADDFISCSKCKKKFLWNCTNLNDYEIKLHKNNPYKPWWCKICLEKYCKKCKKIFPESNCTSISCDKCLYWYHLTCTCLEIAEFEYFQNNPTSNWNCKSCLEKNCKKCNLGTKFKKSIKCNICLNKYHIKCVGVTDPSPDWKCRDCFTRIFPFQSIDNKSLINLHQSYPKKYNLQHIRNEKFSNVCTICTKKLNKPSTGIPCKECKSLIHVKCTKILGISKHYHTWKGNWQCKSCLGKKFPFTRIDNNELINEISFNSNQTNKMRKFKSQNYFSEKLKRLLSSSKATCWNNYCDNDNVNNIISEEINELNSIKPNFMYYEVEKFQNFQKPLKKEEKFGIFHTNVCSLQANIEKLEYLLYDLEYKFDVLALSETWNPEDSKDRFVAKQLEGYHEYYGITGSSRKGGCGFYVRNDLIMIQRNDLDFKINILGAESESCWIEVVSTNKNEKNVVIGVVYRHPSHDDTMFNENFNKILSKVNKEKKRLIVCGDFNYDLLKYDNDNKVNAFFNFMLENNLQPSIIEPTRITNTNKPSLVDNIFTNIFDDPLSGNILENISYDHLPNFMILNRQNRQKDKKILKRSIKDFNVDRFNIELLDPDLILQLQNADSANHAYDIYHKKYLKLLDKHAPRRKLSKKEVKLNKKPWLTTGLMKSISKKRSLYSKFKDRKLKNKNTDETFAKYKEYNDILNKLKRKSKKNFYHKYFNENSSNSKNMWKGINQILNRVKSRNKQIFLEKDNDIITDSRKVANEFNDYFSTVAEKLNSKIIKKNSRFQDYLKNPQKANFNFKETTPDEIVKIIKNLSIKKSSDIYDIAPNFVHLSAQPIAQLLSIIFNRSFKEGIFPDKLKTAKVIPLHKGGSTLSTSNYRPISLLPIFSKIFERLAYNRLIEFIEKNEILSKYQFGFQKNKSTEIAVSTIVSKISDAYEKKKSSYCIFLDFAKAFDTVNHDILLEKMKYYGFRNLEHSWLKSYLTNRTQFTQIDDVMSEARLIKHGVPQGSVLGPLLFLIYINDISESSNILQFILFADDTTVYFSDVYNENTEELLVTELKKVSKWLSANKLSLNVDKSNFLHFHYGKRIKPNMKISINDIEVKEKCSVKYLGTMIDNKLSWKTHIEYIRTKLSKSIGVISKVKYFVTEKVLINLYHAFVQSHVSYNLINWSGASKSNLDPIIKCIKKVIRIITFENRYQHTKNLFQNLNILPFMSQIKHKQAAFMWKLSNGYIPKPLSDLFCKSRFNLL